MGDSSYTLIDDNGVEFFLSPKDKKARRLNGESPPTRSTAIKAQNETIADQVSKPIPSYKYASNANYL